MINGRLKSFGYCTECAEDAKLTSIVYSSSWPMTCGVNRHDRVHIADVLNHRIVRADLFYQTEIEGDIK